MLAFSGKNLHNQSIDPSDIFYIGMTNAIGGINSRISQFLAAIECGKGHSAGNRFYERFCNLTAFSESNMNEKFYYITKFFSCNVSKLSRESKDLKIMGNICKLEYYLPAHVNDKTDKEPELNKK